MNETRFALVPLGVMAGVAFLLSVIGICGVVSYSVAERMQNSPSDRARRSAAGH